jgi:dTDP-4-dehydrorhamnose reductase
VDIRAVTAWAMFGSYDWNSLLTVGAGIYEPGVFAVVDGALERTPLAAMVEELARNGKCLHEPSGEGWWLREERLIYEPRRLPNAGRQSLFERRRARSAPGR